jgi:hypothetical protein
MQLAHDHRIDGIGLEVPAVVVPPVHRSRILVIGDQPGDPHDFRLQPLGPSGFVLAIADGMHPSAHGNAFANGSLGSGIHGRAMFSLAGTTKRSPCGWSHRRSTPSKNPLSKTTLYRRA